MTRFAPGLLNRAERRALARAAARKRRKPPELEELLARINVYDLPRPKSRVETREFVEVYPSSEPGGKQQERILVISIRAGGLADQLRAADEAERMWALWGEGEEGQPPAPLPGDLAERDVVPSRPLFNLACMLWVCQVVEVEEDRYSPLDWVRILVGMPQTAKKLADLMTELLSGSEKRVKNFPGAGTELSSARPSPSPESTQKSPNGETCSSVASMSDLKPSLVSS